MFALYKTDSEGKQVPVRLTLQSDPLSASFYFDLYNLCQNGSSYIHQKPHHCAHIFNEQITRARFVLLQPSIRPIQLKLFYCGRSDQNDLWKLLFAIIIFDTFTKTELTANIDKRCQGKSKQTENISIKFQPS